MKELNGYRLLTEFTADNSGFSQWAFAEKNGIELFIKEFLSPVYPVEESLFDAGELRDRKAYCDAFVGKKAALYSALRQCGSVHIVPVLDFFRYGPKFYIVTEKVKDAGMTPEDVFSLPAGEKITLMRSLCDALTELHGRGVIHADLKPSNLLFEKDVSGGLSVKIIDFDSSFLQGTRVTPEAIEGDPVYLAPETYLAMKGNAAELSAQMDVFALGVIFHQYLLGTLPVFAPGDMHYAFESVLSGAEPVFPPHIDGAVEKMLRGMLLKEPRKRWELKKTASQLKKIDKNAQKGKVIFGK
ncbi:MAG: serine/threonine protein kinase [Clostridia bacterium]